MRRARKGANALEFALILPFLVLLIFSIFELSYFFNRYMVVSAAARDAARTAAMVQVDEEVQEVAEELATAYLERLYGNAEVTVETEVIGAPPTRVVQVTVSTPYQSIIGGYIAIPTDVEATFSLRMEDQL